MKKSKIIISFILIFILILLALITLQFNKSDNNGLIEMNWNNTIVYLINSLSKESDITKNIENDKNWEYYTDVKKIEEYYTNNFDFDFYLLLSIKENDIWICRKINNDKNKQICEEINKNINNKDYLIQYFIKLWDEKKDADMYYNTYLSIKNNNCSLNSEIIQYLICKKIENKNFDVYKYYIKYKILETSNKTIVKTNYKEILKHWQLEEDFNNIILKLIN